MTRHQFAHVSRSRERGGGYVIVDDSGFVAFHPASSTSRVHAAEPWSGKAPDLAAARAEAVSRYGRLDWHDVPGDEPDPVGWAALRVAVANAFA